MISAVFCTRANQVYLIHFPHEIVDKNQYDQLSEFIRGLALVSNQRFVDKVFSMDAKLQGKTKNLVSDILISTICALIQKEDSEKLREFMKILIVFNYDEHIFRALWSLNEAQRKKALLNESVRFWWDASIGTHWMHFREMITMPAPEFAGNYLQMNQRAGKRWGSVLKIEKQQAGGKWDEIDASKEILASEYDRSERKFRLHLYLSPEEQKALQRVIDKHRGTEKGCEPEWRPKLGDADHVRSFVSHWNTVVQENGQGKNCSHQEQQSCRSDQEIPKAAEEQPAESSVEKEGNFLEHLKHYTAHLKEYNPLWSIGILSAVVGFYRLCVFKNCEHTLRQGNHWMHWRLDIGLEELRLMSPETLMTAISPTMLSRGSSKKLFISNEQVLTDFLSELDYEKNLIERYKTMAQRMKTLKLDIVCGVDKKVEAQTDEWLARLQILHQKILDHLVTMKMAYHKKHS